MTRTALHLGSDQAGDDRLLVVEWSMETGLADVTDDTHPDLQPRLHLRSGSFTEIADQMREATDWAKAQGWITPGKAKHNKTLVTRSLHRYKERLRVARSQ